MIDTIWRVPSLPFVVAGLVLAATACSSDGAGGDGNGGTDIDAGDDGDLTVDFGNPDGSPDGGYRSETVGLACGDQGDCTAGEVCVGADPANDVLGYCTILDCLTHPECDFGLETEEVYCCSDFGQFRGCFQEAPGSECGDGTGEQSEDCSTGGQSDCQGEDFFCLDLYGSRFCSAQCDPRTPGSCSDDTWCYPTSGTSGLCLPSGDLGELASCTADPGDCAEGSVCDGGFSDPPGATAYCAHVCGRTGDCLATQWCRVFPGSSVGTCLPRGEAGDGASCVEDRWSCEEGLYCLNEGTRHARCSRLCEGQVDCNEGFECDLFSAQLGICNPVGDRATGEPCDDDPFDCANSGACIGLSQIGYNPDAYCSENCAINPSTCGGDFYCEDFGESGRFCLPDGEAGPGDPCAGPLECEAETVCLFTRLEGEARTGRCQSNCGPGQACGGGEWCTDESGGVCLEQGSLGVAAPCGESPFDCPEGTFCGGNPAICLLGCADDPEACPTGTFCGEDNGRFCFPFGDTALGDPCTDTYKCEPGSFCGFSDDDAGTPGVCTEGCADDTDCSDGFWCLRTGALGVNICVPEGSVGTNGDCSADPFACASGNVCVFRESATAYCARDCTGFANRCASDEVCRWVGNGLSLCLQAGEVAPGGSCAAAATDCDRTSLCVTSGEGDPFCARACTFAVDSCNEGTACTFRANGLGLCLPPDFEGGGPL